MSEESESSAASDNGNVNGSADKRLDNSGKQEKALEESTFGILPVVVLISGSGSNLQALIDSEEHGRRYRIVHVLSNRAGVKGLERAARAGIASSVVSHKAFDKREEFDQALAEKIDAAFSEFRDQDSQHTIPDSHHGLVVLAGFMRILSSAFTERYRGRMVNIHPSLLPKYPGLHTHQRALDAGDTKAGVTVHFVTADLDGGPPIVQAEVAVLQGDSADDLAKRVLTQEHVIYPIVIKWFAEGRLSMRDGMAFLDNKRLPLTGITLQASDQTIAGVASDSSFQK